jgi:hypothetical protein
VAPRPRPSDAERLNEAARELRHDLGKYIRLSAPLEREADTGALRERLRADVLSTRSEPNGVLGAVEVFAAWRAAHPNLPRRGPFAEGVRRIDRAVAAIGKVAPALDRLSREDLERLDQATLEVARGCRALCEAAEKEAKTRT